MPVRELNVKPDRPDTGTKKTRRYQKVNKDAEPMKTVTYRNGDPINKTFRVGADTDKEAEDAFLKVYPGAQIISIK